MGLFKGNKIEENEFEGKACALDSTIGCYPKWVEKNASKGWTEEESKYRNEIRSYLQGIKSGGKDAAGNEVSRLIIRADEYVIYEIKSAAGANSMRIDVRTLVEEDDLMLKRWTEVARQYYITKRVLFKVNDHSVRERIANIISRALSTGYSSEAVHDLKQLQKDINNTYNERIQNSLKYLGTIVSITLCFVSISLFIYANGCFLNQENLRLLVFSATAGCIGGFFSVSTRLRLMTFEREIPSISYILYGFERMIVSICAAIVALLAIKSGLIFQFAKDSIYGLILVAVAAGFSETLIPNLLVKMETDTEKK